MKTIASFPLSSDFKYYENAASFISVEEDAELLTVVDRNYEIAAVFRINTNIKVKKKFKNVHFTKVNVDFVEEGFELGEFICTIKTGQTNPSIEVHNNGYNSYSTHAIGEHSINLVPGNPGTDYLIFAKEEFLDKKSSSQDVQQSKLF